MRTKLDKTADTFIRLLEKYPYPKITIKMICDETPVNRSSFYYHFESKENLVEWICQRDFQKYSLPYFHIHTDNISAKSFFTYLKDKSAFYSKLATVNSGQLLQNCLAKAYSGAADTEEMVKEYGNPVHNDKLQIDIQVYHRYAAAGIASVILYWIENGMKIPIDQIATDLSIMLRNSLEDVRDNYLF